MTMLLLKCINTATLFCCHHHNYAMLQCIRKLYPESNVNCKFAVCTSVWLSLHLLISFANELYAFVLFHSENDIPLKQMRSKHYGTSTIITINIIFEHNFMDGTSAEFCDCVYWQRISQQMWWKKNREKSSTYRREYSTESKGTQTFLMNCQMIWDNQNSNIMYSA